MIAQRQPSQHFHSFHQQLNSRLLPYEAGFSATMEFPLKINSGAAGRTP
jgi:hypothetical protein